MLESIVVPEGVTSIGSYAFFHCLGLTSVTVPGSVRTIQVDVFGECSDNLTIYGPANSSIELYTKIANPPINFIAIGTQPTPERPSSWAAELVSTATALGLVPENLQGKYTQAATRAEFCALAVALYETATGTVIEGRQTFHDTTDIHVEKMASLGVVNGTGDGNFDPDAKLTREQAATMLSRLAEAMGKQMVIVPPSFSDAAAISTWAGTAVGQMQATGIMTGMGDNTFAPKSEYTREQSIITILRLYDFVQ